MLEWGAALDGHHDLLLHHVHRDGRAVRQLRVEKVDLPLLLRRACILQRRTAGMLSKLCVPRTVGVSISDAEGRSSSWALLWWS